AWGWGGTECKVQSHSAELQICPSPDSPTVSARQPRIKSGAGSLPASGERGKRVRRAAFATIPVGGEPAPNLIRGRRPQAGGGGDGLSSTKYMFFPPPFPPPSGEMEPALSADANLTIVFTVDNELLDEREETPWTSRRSKRGSRSARRCSAANTWRMRSKAPTNSAGRSRNS